MSFLPALRALKDAFAADLIDEDEFRQHKAKPLEQMREDAAAAVVTPSPSPSLCRLYAHAVSRICFPATALKAEGQVVFRGESSDPSTEKARFQEKVSASTRGSFLAPASSGETIF